MIERLRRALAAASAQGLLAVWALAAVIPLLWAVISAFKSNADLFSTPWELPSTWHFDNFVRAWGRPTSAATSATP